MAAWLAAMNILYSHRTKSADGQQVHIRALAEALEARGHTLFMAGPDDFGTARSRPLDAAYGAGALRSRLPRAIHEIGELLYAAPAYLKLRAAARAAKPDILYERYNLFFFAGARLARTTGLPFILEVNAPLSEERAEHHRGLALKRVARWSERALWRAADKVLPVSDALARMVNSAGVPFEKIEVVRNGVDDAFLQETDPRPVLERYGLVGKTVLGFAGFVRSWHGVDRAVRYLARSRRDDLRLLIVGDGDARADIERLASAIGVADRLVVTGVIQRSEMAAHVAAFDIALQPAVTTYASPLKLFEYMGLGRAIAAPASGNIREVLEDGRDALLFAPDDEADLFRCLDALVDDSDLRLRLGAAARAKLIREDLTWAANAARVERIAEGLLERRR